MTLVNLWTASGGNGGDRGADVAVLQCDGCLPPRIATAQTEAYLAAAGWRFDDLRTGPHLCPGCAHRSRRGGVWRRSPREPHPALPNVLIIGAAKSGTSSLHAYLAEHPRAHMSRPKELRFFSDPACPQRLELYASFFDGRAAVRGESSPTYTMDPLIPGVPERIHSAVPDVKLIYLVRDPVDRVTAMYAERHAQAPWITSPTQALRDLTDSHNPYMAPGRYATQLERYLSVFDGDRVLVVDQADLLDRRRDTLRRVFRFLELDDDFWSPRFELLQNTRANKVRWSPTGLRLADSRAAVALRHMIPGRTRAALIRPVKRMTTSRLRVPAFDDELRQRVRAASRDEVERLRELTGQRFGTWQV